MLTPDQEKMREAAKAAQWKWPNFEDWLASPINPPQTKVEYVQMAFNAGRATIADQSGFGGLPD